MYNNYNPYYNNRYVPEQMPNNRLYLNGKIVDSIDAVKATDVQFDGSISYFPLANGSAIITKQLQSDGTSKIVIYKPEKISDDVKYVTIEDLNKKIDSIKFDGIKEDVLSLKKEFKELKNKLKEDD